MLALRLFNTRNCVRLSRTLPQSFYRLSHGDSSAQERGKRVYEGTLRVRLRWVKFLSLSSTAVFLGVSPVIFSKFFTQFSNAWGWTASVGYLVISTSTPFILQGFTNGYVVELRFEPQAKIFEADTFDFFGRTRTVKFTQDDVDFPGIIGPLSNLTIKEKSYLIDINDITDNDAFDCLMKYDKPIDLMLGPDADGGDKK